MSTHIYTYNSRRIVPTSIYTYHVRGEEPPPRAKRTSTIEGAVVGFHAITAHSSLIADRAMRIITIQPRHVVFCEYVSVYVCVCLYKCVCARVLTHVHVYTYS